LGSLASGALTAASTLVVTIAAALVGVVIAREFGRTEETDGFFAAYGVFLVIVLAAQSVRVAAIPALTQARAEGRLAGEIAGFAVAMAFVALPLVILVELFASPIADLLTGDASPASTETAADALRWMVPAAAAHLFAGIAASGLAALDDYATAAAGYAAGSAVGLAFILVRVEPDGIIAVAWGMALNAAVALAIPLVALVLRAMRLRMPASAVRHTGQPVRTRLGVFAAAASLPIALQMLYVVCLPFAGRLGTGAVTSFGYAYLAAASLVTVTAFSLGLVTSAPLVRAGVDADGIARHVIAAAWVALTLIAAAAGVFAVVGAELVEALLGEAYGGDVGAEVARLVVVLSPWIVASVGVYTAFPLVFVVGRTRFLPVIAVVALGLQVLLAWAAVEVAELDGLAVALALSTLLVLTALLAELGAAKRALQGLAVAAAVVAGFALVAFVPPAALLGSVAAAAVGLFVYGVLVALVRPRGLRASWSYLRALR
jgi:O-antigen/teichoic acid export membrane protein